MDERSSQKRRHARISTPALLFFVALLIAPALGLVRISDSVGWQFAAGYTLAMCGLTFLAYWHDKRRAQQDGWRTPESTLHLMELSGGWPAAFLAQRFLRHKIVKRDYQVNFWAIVVLHQYLWIDYLQDWRLIGWATAALQR